MNKVFIVKLQLPLNSNMENPPALIYNQDRSINAMVPITKGVNKVMNGRPKAFFWATVRGTELVIGEEAEWQTW